MKTKYGNETLSIIKSIGIGLCASILCLVASCMILALLMVNENMSLQLSSYGVCGALAVSAAIAAWIASIGNKEKALILSAISGGAYLIILLSIHGIFFHGPFQSVGVTALLILGASIAVGIARFVGKRQPSRRHIRCKNHHIV